MNDVLYAGGASPATGTGGGDIDVSGLLKTDASNLAPAGREAIAGIAVASVSRQRETSAPVGLFCGEEHFGKRYDRSQQSFDFCFGFLAGRGFVRDYGQRIFYVEFNRYGPRRVESLNL